MGARLDELEERVARLVPDLEAAGRHEAEAAEVLADARTRLEQAEESARSVGERFGAVEEGVRDARGRLEQAEHGLDRLRTTLDERLDDLDRRVAGLRTIPAAPPRQPTRVALGLSDRPEARTDTHAETDGAKGADDAAVEAGADAPGHHEDMSTGMRGVLLVVIGLAALTMLLHWMGVGR